MRSLSLFTGYGGLDLALEEYATTIGYCEIEPYAQAIIASRIGDGSLPPAPIYPDVTKLRGQPNDCDIIVGGFPCQDISVAGRGVGLEGKRSGLFFEIIRLTKEIKPSFVFLENVPAIRTRGLLEVIREFTEIGYDCRWTCLSAASLGAPHKRERWFLLAHAACIGLEGVGIKGIPSATVRKKEFSEAPNSCFARHWWAVESGVGRVAHGVISRVDRIKALGNGVVPLQAKTALERLLGGTL